MVIEGKVAIGILCVLLGVALTSYSRLMRASDSNFRITVFGIWLVTRVGLFIAIYGIMRMDAQSDVLGYIRQGHAAMRGLWVYRDFGSSYAPIFPYVVAGALKWIWASSKVMVLLAILAEGVSLVLWMSATARLLPAMDARRAALLYVASATPLVNVVMEGQNQVWVAAFLAAAVWLYARGREQTTAVVLSIPIFLVKFLSLLMVPAFLFWSKKRVAFAAIFAVLPLLVYGFFLAKGVVFDAITALALGAMCLWFLRQTPRVPATATLWAMVITMMTLLLLSKKAYTSYLILIFYPICALAAARATDWLRSAAFGVFGAIAMIERTLWFRWLGARQLPDLGLTPAGSKPSLTVIFLCLDMVLLAFYGWFWHQARTQLESLSVAPLRDLVPVSSER